jgi:homoserine O-acetyltransferase
MGHSSLEDFLVGGWEGFFLDRDANDLLTMLWTWQHANVGNTPGFDGDYQKALRSITARALVMSADGDLFFPPEDEIAAVELIASNSEFRLIPTSWGHFAGAGVNMADAEFIDRALKQLLSEAG